MRRQTNLHLHLLLAALLKAGKTLPRSQDSASEWRTARRMPPSQLVGQHPQVRVLAAATLAPGAVLCALPCLLAALLLLLRLLLLPSGITLATPRTLRLTSCNYDCVSLFTAVNLLCVHFCAVVLYCRIVDSVDRVCCIFSVRVSVRVSVPVSVPVNASYALWPTVSYAHTYACVLFVSRLAHVWLNVSHSCLHTDSSVCLLLRSGC